MIEIEQAVAMLLDAGESMERETVGLESALGRVLAETVATDRDLPPTDRSAMDGFAVRCDDLPEPGRMLDVVGEIRAGCPAADIRVGPGSAVRIMTGAEIPIGADAVVMVELTEEDREAGRVLIRERPEPGQHIRRRGQDVAGGEVILRPGHPIHAAEIAALASVGHVRVQVYRRPLVRLLSTGDEIVAPDDVPAPHQVRNSNAATLRAQLAGMGLPSEDLGIAPDDRDRLRPVVETGLEADLFLLTGGVSMGEYDLVREELERAGVEVLFHKVAVKPGKPILAGRRRSCVVVGLPGNPVSAFTGFHVFVAPSLRRRMGLRRHRNEEIQVVLERPLRGRPDRTTYHLAEIVWKEGTWRATPVKTTGSGDVVSMVRANGFAISSPGPRIEAGARVPALLWPGHSER